MTLARGNVRDSILDYLATLRGEASVAEIYDVVCRRIGDVPPSSVRSYLNLNTPSLFERTAHGRYRLRTNGSTFEYQYTNGQPKLEPVFRDGKCRLYQADCFMWLEQQPPNSIHAVVTDPPYGLVEYSEIEQTKLRNGSGGVWRIPPSFDGHHRSPVPRFTVLNSADKENLHFFFKRLGALLARVVVPGGNILVASNPLLSHIVSTGMIAGGLELRGTVVRLVMTMRGGDRPKNAHKEFDEVSVMPRSMWEPWVVLRRPIDGRIQDNLRKWKTGGFRRYSTLKPFGDVIRSSPTPKIERRLAPHPSLKPQDFLRQLVRAALPLKEGVILDPFAGSGSTLAAANAVDYASIGIESDERYVKIAKTAIAKLALL
jgi:DNA modification methylase